MFGAILKATNSSFQKGITFCRSIYVKRVMKLLASILEQPSYVKVSKSVLIMHRRKLKSPSQTERLNDCSIQKISGCALY